MLIYFFRNIFVHRFLNAVFFVLFFCQNVFKIGAKSISSIEIFKNLQKKLPGGELWKEQYKFA